MSPIGESTPPLVEIERAVQARAKEVALDMAGPGGDAALRALIDAEVDRWSLDFKRGSRTHDLAVFDEEIIDGDVQSSREGVQVRVHALCPSGSGFVEAP